VSAARAPPTGTPNRRYASENRRSTKFSSLSSPEDDGGTNKWPNFRARQRSVSHDASASEAQPWAFHLSHSAFQCWTMAAPPAPAKKSSLAGVEPRRSAKARFASWEAGPPATMDGRNVSQTLRPESAVANLRSSSKKPTIARRRAVDRSLEAKSSSRNASVASFRKTCKISVASASYLKPARTERHRRAASQSFSARGIRVAAKAAFFNSRHHSARSVKDTRNFSSKNPRTAPAHRATRDASPFCAANTTPP